MKDLLKRLKILFPVLFLTACTRTQPEPQVQQVQLTLAEIHVAGHPVTQAMMDFSDRVYSATEGRVNIRVIAAGEEGSENSSIAQVRNGELDLARVSSVTLSEYSPQFISITLPYVFDSREHMWAYVTSDYGRQLLAHTEGYEGLAWVENGARCFYSDEPVHSPEDMEGKTYRIPISDVMTDLLRSCGAKITTVDLSSVYTSVAEGSIDGAENDIISYDFFANDVVAPYYTLNYHSYAPSLIIACSDLKDKLGEEDYNIVKKCALETERVSRSFWDESMAEIMPTLEDKGVTLIQPDEDEMNLFREAAYDIYDNYPQCSEAVEQIRAMAP